MPTPQQVSRDVMSSVNSVMAAINLYPEIDTTNTQYSFSASANPINLFIDFFKSTKGYDWLVEKISEYIAYAIPALELSVKGILLSNIRIMLSCSINPLITEYMIKNGVVFDLNRLDLLGMFNFSPLDKSVNNLGRYYYFGCDPEDGINIIDDVKKSRDFNAVLWYAKNTPGERIVWRRKMDVGKPINFNRNLKQVKSNGIATIEFNGRSTGLSDSEGGEFYVQEPINNCVHVFIGNCTPEVSDSHIEDIANCTRLINEYNKLSKKLSEIDNKITETQKTNTTVAIEDGATADVINDIWNKAEYDHQRVDDVRLAINGGAGGNETMLDVLGTDVIEFNSIHEILQISNDLITRNVVRVQAYKIDLMSDYESSSRVYPSATSNYYYMRPLFEWNSDFIMSMKLFDEKVITAQLLNTLTNCLSLNIDVNVTAQMKFIQSQMRELVTKIIETDDGVVSDCFFSFTNDSYNRLLNEVELNRVGLQPASEQTVNAIPSAEDVMSALNTLSHDATQEEVKSVVSGSLFTAIGSTHSVENSENSELLVDINANFSIIDQLLTQLTYVIVLTIIQPKIYILLMTNLRIVGSEPNFDLAKFMQQFSDLISQIIKEVRDNIFEYFKNELLKVMAELVKTLSVKLSLEQYQYYVALLTHCLNCFKTHGNSGDLDWMQDDVDYADITELNQEYNEEC